MIRGQSEYIGAVVLATLTIIVVYVASEWLSLIHSVSKNAVEVVENMKEVIDVAFNDGNVTIFNRSPRKSYIELMYVKLLNGTIVIKKVDTYVAPGKSIDFYLGYKYDNAYSVCIETANGNVFCGYKTHYTAYSHIEYWSYERLPPTYLSFDPVNHVPYRAKRVIAPNTYFYVYAVPVNHVAIATAEDEMLQAFNIYVNTDFSDINEGKYIIILANNGVKINNLSNLVDHNDYTSALYWDITKNDYVLDVCIDLSEIETGWFYIHYIPKGGLRGEYSSYMFITVSNNSCKDHQNNNKTIYFRFWQGESRTRVSAVWLVTARSIRVYSYQYTIDLYSLEFYPYNITRNILGFPSSIYRNPIATTLSVFVLSNTHIQILELTMVPKLDDTNN
ncbi:MAG: hypothetical protein QXL96_08730 [Ignisphaera sp.]